MASPVTLLMTAIFWLGRFVRVRLIGWGFVALLAAVAYFSARLALDTQTRTPRTNAAVGQKHAPDFTAKQFTFWRSSLDGRTQYQVSAANMVHYRDDLSSVLVKPDIHAITLQAKPGATLSSPTTQHARMDTHIKADQGLIRNDGELVQFTRNVKVTRTATGVPVSTLQSASLVLMPDTDWVVTRSPVTLSQGKNTTTAQGGLEYTHSDADLQLIGPVTMRLPAK